MIVMEASGVVVKLKVCTVQAMIVTVKLLVKGGTPG